MLLASLSLLLLADLAPEVRQALAARNYAGAYRLVQGQVERSPNAPGLLAAAGGISFQAGEYRDAVRWLRRADELTPLDAGHRFTLAMAHAALRQRGPARVELEKLPVTAHTVYWLARLDHADGNYRRAVERFRHALRLDPVFSRAWDGLGLSLQATAQVEEAIAAHEQAIRTSGPRTPWPAYNLGTLFARLDRTSEAEAAFRQALACSAGFSPALYGLGRLEEQRGNDRRAVELIESAVTHDATYAEAHYALGRIYRRLGEPARADAALARFARTRHAQRVILP